MKLKTERYGAFLLYVDDWLSSTAIEVMTAAEERGYLRLLMHAWKADDCGLPDDDRVLAQLSKLGSAWRGKSGEAVRAHFVARDGRLFNERLLAEREYQRQYRTGKSEAGKAGAAVRWESHHSKNDGITDGKAIAKPLADAWQIDANPNPNPIEKHTQQESLEGSKPQPLTQEIEDEDRDYCHRFAMAFAEKKGRFPESWECPARLMDWETDPDDEARVLSIAYGEWCLGAMPFENPATWGMVHFVPQADIDRMNRCIAPKEIGGVPFGQLSPIQIDQWKIENGLFTDPWTTERLDAYRKAAI